MLGDKFRLPAPSPSAIAESRLVSMGTCTRLQRVRGEISVFGGGVTTEQFHKCTLSFSRFEDDKHKVALCCHGWSPPGDWLRNEPRLSVALDCARDAVEASNCLCCETQNYSKRCHPDERCVICDSEPVCLSGIPWV